MNKTFIETELVYSLAPRYIRRWFVSSIVLTIIFFATYHRQTVDKDSPPSHPSTWSWLVLGLWVVITVWMWAKAAYYRHHGRPASENSHVENIVQALRKPSAPRTAPLRVVVVPKDTEVHNLPETAPQEPLVVIKMGKARSTEEHEGFTVTDRRRFAHLVDE